MTCTCTDRRPRDETTDARQRKRARVRPPTAAEEKRRRRETPVLLMKRAEHLWQQAGDLEDSGLMPEALRAGIRARCCYEKSLQLAGTFRHLGQLHTGIIR